MPALAFSPALDSGINNKYHKRIGYGLLIGGIVLVLIKGCMNWFMGELLGVTAAGKWLSSIGSVSIDVVGLMMCGTAAGACIVARRYGWGFIFAVAMILSTPWSYNSIMSFQATERISASKNRIATIDRDAKADKMVGDNSRWYASVAARTRAKDARKDLIAASANEVKAFRDTKVEARIEPDAGAAVWSRLTGRPLEQVQMFQSGYFAFLIIFLSSVCFPGSGYFLNPLSVLSNKQKGDPGGDGESSGGAASDGGGKETTESRKDLAASVASVESRPQKVDTPPVEKVAPAARPAASVPQRRDPKVEYPDFGRPTPKRVTDKRVDLKAYLAEHLAHNGVIPSQRKICRDTGWSEPKVSKFLRKMEMHEGGIVRLKYDNKRSVARQRIGDGGGYNAIARA